MKKRATDRSTHMCVVFIVGGALYTYSQRTERTGGSKNRPTKPAVLHAPPRRARMSRQKSPMPVHSACSRLPLRAQNPPESWDRELDQSQVCLLRGRSRIQEPSETWLRCAACGCSVQGGWVAAVRAPCAPTYCCRRSDGGNGSNKDHLHGTYRTCGRQGALCANNYSKLLWTVWA